MYIVQDIIGMFNIRSDDDLDLGKQILLIETVMLMLVKTSLMIVRVVDDEWSDVNNDIDKVKVVKVNVTSVLYIITTHIRHSQILKHI